jgi:hypothetical protein
MDVKHYYELKQKYQERINSKKLKIRKDNALTIKEKQAKYKKIANRCVNCDKPGGTLFEEKNGMMKAVCASKTPCNLNINIKRVRYDNMRDLEIENDKVSENLKMRIIMTKLDYLFGINNNKDDIIDKFNELKEKLAAVTEKQLVINKNYGDIISGINRDPLLNDANADLAIEIDELKKLYEEYSASSATRQTSTHLTEMIEKYITKILPLTETIRKLKYGYYEIERSDEGQDDKENEDDEKGNLKKNKIIYTLVANPYRLEQMEQEQK